MKRHREEAKKAKEKPAEAGEEWTRPDAPELTKERARRAKRSREE